MPPAVPSNGRIELNRVEKGWRLLTQNGHFEFPILSLSRSLPHPFFHAPSMSLTWFPIPVCLCNLPILPPSPCTLNPSPTGLLSAVAPYFPLSPSSPPLHSFSSLPSPHPSVLPSSFPCLISPFPSHLPPPPFCVSLEEV